MISNKLLTVVLSVILSVSLFGVIYVLPESIFYPSNFKDISVLPTPHLIYGKGINITVVDRLGFTHKYTDSHSLKIRSTLGVQLTTKQLINSNYPVVATSIALFTDTLKQSADQIEVGIFKGNTALGNSIVPQGFIVNWIDGEKHDVVLLGAVPKNVEIMVDENGVVFITIDGDVREYAHIQKQYVYNFGYDWLEEVSR